MIKSLICTKYYGSTVILMENFGPRAGRLPAGQAGF